MDSLEGSEGEYEELTGFEKGLEDDGLEKPQRLCHVCSKIVDTGFRVGKEFYHINCFRCCKCGLRLNITDFLASGGQLYCSRHFEQLLLKKSVKHEEISIPALPNSSASNAPIFACKGCGYEVQDGVCVSEDLYHPDCLKCDTCKQPVDVKHFKVMDGKIYCLKDYSKKMEKVIIALKREPRHPKDKTNRRHHKSSQGEWCVTCQACNSPVIEGMFVQNAYYHLRCFRCARCRVYLRLDRYEILNGKNYCSHDYEKVLAKQTAHEDKSEAEPENLLQNIDQCEVCCQCYSAVKAGWYIKGGIYHTQCLKCTTCQDILLINKCKEHEGEIYCLQDYKKIVPQSSSKHPQRNRSSSNAHSAKAESATRKTVNVV